MKIQKVNKNYVLTISEEVAAVLMAIFNVVGGGPDDTPRGVIDCLRDLFRAAAGKRKFGSPFRSFPTKSGNIFFEKCGMEVLKKDIAESRQAIQDAEEEAAGAKTTVASEYIIYIGVDTFGGKWSTVAEESGVIVQIYGLKKADGAPALFESEAYHLANYCKENGIQLSEFRKTEYFTVPTPPPAKAKRKTKR